MNRVMMGIDKNNKQSTTTNTFKNSPFEMNDGSNHTFWGGDEF